MVKRSTKSGVDKAKKPAKAKAVKAPPPPEKPATTQAEINRIGDIIKNARGTWFGLLGALVFAAVTLASVKDASFFIPSEQTKLPLLGISVPITSFFWAGALLITALYTYLHLYLVQLWDALGDADPQFEGKPLADVIHPWLVSDAALRVRDRMRKTKDGEHCSRQRGMSMVGNIISILLVWVFGLAVIGWFWWRSMPAHDIWLTSWLGALFAWSLRVFWCSRTYALIRLGELTTDKSPPVWLLILLIMIVNLTVLRTHIDIFEGDPRIDRSSLTKGCSDYQKEIDKRTWCPYLTNVAQELLRPARAEMAETVFTQKPSNWKGYELAKQEFRLRWCKQMGEKECKINPLNESSYFNDEEEKKFEKAWKNQFAAILVTFNKPDLRGKRLEGADLRFTELEGVRLEKARLQGANLSGAKLQGVDLKNAKLQGSVLKRAKLQGANLTKAKMQDADLSWSRIQGADLRSAVMSGADFTGAEIHGTPKKKINLQSTNLSAANFSGSSLRFIDFTSANMTGIMKFGTSFGDYSVRLPVRMKRPKHWCKKKLSDREYWGRYRGWLLMMGGYEEYDNYFDKYPTISFGVPCPE